MARVFISHSSRDAASAARIKVWLEGKGFEAPFLDFDKHAGIAPGANWEKTLYREIELSEAIIILQTPNWLESKWCFAEYTQARALGKAIFPIIETPVGDTLIAPDIQAVDLLKDREGGLEMLARELTRIALNAQGGFNWDASRPPYPGLNAFQAEDAAIYFGRDDDIRRLVERLNARRAHGGTRIIALLGASGSGKSSLLRAGVIPRIKRDKRNWIVLPPMRPQSRPVDELARTITVALDKDGDWRALRDQLRGPDAAVALGNIAGDLRIAADAAEAQILIPIDQAEELYTTTGPAEADRFFEILNAAMSGDLPFMAILAQRSDFLEKLQSAAKLTARFEEFSLPPLPLSRIPQIIEGPARVAGLGIEEGLVLQASRDAETEDALPLLAFTLRELYDRYGDDNHLSLKDYEALGDAREGLTPIENAVRKAADDVLAEARPSEKELAALRDAFVPAMVRVNGRGEYVRSPARWDALPADSHRLLEQLARARLLSIGQKGDARLVDIAHEALLRRWPRLRNWLDEAREFLIGRQQLDVDLLDWRNAPDAKKNDALLSGLKLARGISWLSERSHQLTSKHRKFIENSLAFAQAVERSRARMRAIVTYGSLVASLLMTVLGLVAILQWGVAVEHRERAHVRQWLGIIDQAARVGNQGNDVNRLLLAMEVRSQLASSEAGDPLRRLQERAASRLLAFTSLPESLLKFLRRITSTVGLRHLAAVESEQAIFGALNTRREVAVLRGHETPVMAIAISHDAARMATGDQKGRLQVWDTRSRSLLRVLDGHKGVIRSIAFSRDGRLLLTASDDHTARVWDVYGGKEPGVLKHEGEVAAARFNHDATMIVTASNDKTVGLWDAATFTRQARLAGHTDKVNDVLFTRDGAFAMSASDDHRIGVWDVRQKRHLRWLARHDASIYRLVLDLSGGRMASAGADGWPQLWEISDPDPAQWRNSFPEALRGHEGEVFDVQFSPDGQYLLTASEDETARIWSVRSGKNVFVLKGHEGRVHMARWSGDGKLVLTASADTTARTWDAATGKPLSILRGHLEVIYSARYDPAGDFIVTGSEDKTVRIWDVSQGSEVSRLSGDGQAYKHTAPIVFADVTLDGTRAVTASLDKQAILWDLTRSAPIAALPHEEAVWRTRISRDGNLVATSSDDKMVKVWDAHSGRPIWNLKGHRYWVAGLAFSPDSRFLVSSSGDKSVRIWDLGTGEQKNLLLGHSGDVRWVEYDSDGSMIVSAGGDGKVMVWDSTSGARIAAFNAGTKLNIARFSLDGTQVVAAGEDGVIRAWSIKSKSETRSFSKHAKDVYFFAFDPAGRLLATASRDQTVKIWDFATGTLLQTLKGHNRSVTDLDFGHDGLIMTASEDGTARLWDSRTGTEVLVIRGHGDQVVFVRFLAGNKKLLTASRDKTLRIWRLPQDRKVFTPGYQLQVNLGRQSGGAVTLLRAGAASTPRIPLASADALMKKAREQAPRCLSANERREARLDPVPPGWCFESRKWPYHQGSRQEWFAANAKGEKRPMPSN